MNGAAVLAFVALGVAVGVAAAWVWLSRDGQRSDSGTDPLPRATVGVDIPAVLRSLSSVGIVLDANDRPIHVTAGAETLGVIKGARLVDDEIAAAAQGVRRSGRPESLVLRRVRGRGRAVILNARLASIGEQQVLVLIDDTTHERRVDDVRRDFVANVSHELKTPIAALSLLAESVLAAADDRVAVERFTERMQFETMRLSSLVNELIDLSRLEGDAPLESGTDVDVGEMVDDAVSQTRLSAEANDIELATSVEPGLRMWGDHQQVVSALANLIKNAIAYSPPGTRVAIAAKRSDSWIEIGVTDQGIGISPRDVDRIFERFYRVDPARSRATGGTGLGLSIVKHVCVNHDGEVDVWSVEGAGSTFTLRFPAPTPSNQTAMGNPDSLAKESR